MNCVGSDTISTVPWWLAEYCILLVSSYSVFSLSQASPQLMSLMIGFVTSHALGTDSEPTWKGYFYAITLLCSTMTNTVMLSQYFERMFTIGMNLRTTLISAIYRKALRMSGSAR